MCDMEPINKQPEHNDQEAPQNERINLNDYDNSTIDEKEALKAHSADTPEGLHKALVEQMGGAEETVRPNPNEFK